MNGLFRSFRSRVLAQVIVVTILLSSAFGAPFAPSRTLAAGDVVVYGDGLAGGWQNWSWDTTVNFAAASPVHGGSRSLAFTYNRAWAGLYVHVAGINTSGYSALQFYLNGGSASGQRADVVLYDANARQIPSPQPIDKYIQGGSIAAGQWRAVTVPLADLRGSNTTIAANPSAIASSHLPSQKTAVRAFQAVRDRRPVVALLD